MRFDTRLFVRPDQSIEDLQIALIKAKNDRNKKEQIKILNTIGFNLKYDKKFSDSIDYFRKSLKLVSGTNPYVECFILKELGHLMGIKENYEQSLKFLDQAESIATNNNVKEPINDIFMMKAYRFLRLEEFSEAQVIYTKLLDKFEKSENIYGQCRMLNELGHVLLKQGKFDEAEEHYNRCLILSNDIGTTLQGVVIRMNSYLGLSNYYEAMEEYEKAIDFVKKMIEFDEMYRNIESKGFHLSMISRLYEKASNYSEAKKHAELALSILTKIRGVPKSEINRLSEFLIEIEQKTSKFD